MIKSKSLHLTVAVLVIGAVMVAAGGLAVASNMGFKMNKPLYRPVAGGGSDSGFNWTSLPYHGPYGNAGAFCAQTGLPSVSSTIFVVDPVSGGTTNVTCGTTSANNLQIVPGRGLRIRGTLVPTSIIIVGSHNPSLPITIPANNVADPEIGQLWFSVPYHTTAVTAQDLCVQAGIPNLGGTVRRVNAQAGSGTTLTCGTTSAAQFNLILGEAVRMATTAATGARTFTPAHF